MAEANDNLVNPIYEAADLNDAANVNEAYEDKIEISVRLIARGKVKGDK